MNAPLRTARVLREERRAAWAAFLHGLFCPTGTSQAEAARLSGAGATKVAQWCDADHEAQMPVSDVEAMPDRIRVAIAERILGPGYRVSRSEGADTGVGDDLRAMSRIAQQSGDVVAHYAAALADGAVSPEEAGGMLPVIHELVRSLSTLEHDLERTVKERGRRLRSVLVGVRA